MIWFERQYGVLCDRGGLGKALLHTSRDADTARQRALSLCPQSGDHDHELVVRGVRYSDWQQISVEMVKTMEVKPS